MRKKIWKTMLLLLLTVQLVMSDSISLLAAGEQSAESKTAQPEQRTAGSKKNYVAKDKIKAVTADSYQSGYGPEKAVDGVEDDSNNCWHTPWEAAEGEEIPGFPHWIQVEFTETQTVDSFVYVARKEDGFQFVTEYEVWTSPDNNEANLTKAAEGTWTRAKTATAEFAPQEAVLVRFVTKAKVDSNYNDTTSVSASEIKFGLFEFDSAENNQKIQKMTGTIDRILDYAALDMGEGEHQFKKDSVDALKAQKDTLISLIDSSDVNAINAALQSANDTVAMVLASNKTEEEGLTVSVPKAAMSASANTENEGYEAEKAVDGNLDTMWHTEWAPTLVKHPHELTVDLGQSVMLSGVTITPRRDMGSGRIKAGELYAGDDKDNLELVTTFSAMDIVTVPVEYYKARYIMIKALEGSDANTAIAEVDVSVYDRGYAFLLKAYGDAVDTLGNAQVGEEIGQFSEADKKAFEDALAGFAEELKKEHLNSECYELAENIKKEEKSFLEKIKRYSLKDLKQLIEEGKELAKELEGKDKELLESAVKAAENVVENKDSSATEIHEAALALKATIDGLKAAGEEQFDLSGKWNFSMSEYAVGSELSDNVTLPGTLDENKKGSYNTFRDPRRLSRYYVYTGPATYQRQVFIPNSWEGKKLSLFMERSRETQVWVNDTEILAPDTANAIAVSQVYDLTGNIKYGELNTITIEVDNSYPNTPKAAITNSSMATEETQTNWNGIVGTFELRVDEMVNIADLRVYPNEDLQSASVEVEMENKSDTEFNGEVTVCAEGLEPRAIPVQAAAGEIVEVSITDYAMGSDVKLWSEFSQNLYTMTASLENGSKAEEKFGMRVFGVDQETKQLTNNGDKVFLRNEANCAVFPLTAYAPMDEAGWEHLFASYQSYGINSVRFHSWCPPDAAFRVADRMGMFLQPELSSWDAGSMFDGEIENNYYDKEAKAIVKEYANHPSFVMFTFGNELVFAGGGYEHADGLIQELKEQDSTRLYSFASNAGYGGTAPTANSDFFTGQVYRGTTMRGIYAGMSGFINNSRPATVVNYNEAVARAANEAGIPAFSFEVGQFQVFPDVLTELEQYTGVLEPRNLQLVEERLADNNITDETTKKWIDASGMLSRIGYRMEIEAALRTKNMSGISLLGIQDFSGQSTALVGMMNALGDPKPYDFANPQEFAKFFSPEVALLETEKFTWTNAESLNGKLMLANYGPDDLKGKMFYRLEDGAETIAEGDTETVALPQGDVTTAGEISIPLDGVKEARQLKLTIGFGDIENTYDVWVYPADEKASEGDVYIAEFLDQEAMYVLEDGGKVLLTPKANKSTLPNSITGTFTTAFWSSQFVSESQPGSMGLLMDPEHPVFNGFPTEYHSNYQWWSMAKLGRPMVLENLTQEDGTEIQPLVQVLDSFSTVRTMGLLYEAKVGDGKLMVSSMGLDQLQAQYPEARALRNSILDYMNSNEFDPQFEVSTEKIKEAVIGTESDPRLNVAEKSNGGNVQLGENTTTCQEGYDNNPQDRALELNDGRVDVDTPSRSWTDWSGAYKYQEAEITAKFDKAYTVDTVELPFYEDYGCKAPAEIRVDYWDGEKFVPVSNPSQTTGFVKGSNTIAFDAAETEQIRITMVRQKDMGIALSEFIVYEKKILAEVIQIMPKDEKTTIKLGETLELGVTYQPENANDTDIRWRALDAEGNKSQIAKISISGVLTPTAAGEVYVKASLKSNEEIADTIKITVVAQDKGTLKDLLAEAKKVEKDKYTVDGYKAFKAVLGAAEKVYEDKDASEQSIADAVKNLKEAFEKLEKNIRATDKETEALNQLIKESEELAKKYPKFAEALKKLTADAKELLAKGQKNLTMAEVKEMAGKLSEACDEVKDKAEADKPDEEKPDGTDKPEDGNKPGGSGDKDANGAQTGDTQNAVGLMIILAIAASVIAGCIIVIKKRRRR